MTFYRFLKVVVFFILTMSFAHSSLQAIPSARAQRAKIGRDGWLIYTSYNDSNLKDFRRKHLRSDNELQLAYENVHKFQLELAKLGISFAWFVIPNTPTVYPESIPRHIKPLPGPSRLEQLASYLSERNIPFFNVAEPLQNAKKLGRLYQKTDTHWNDLGAYIGYQFIISSLQVLPKLSKSLDSAMPLDQFQISTRMTNGGDLANMLALQDIFREEAITLTPLQPRRATVKNLAGKDFMTERKDLCPKGLRMVMYRDSFASALQPFLSEHFCQASYYWSWEISETVLSEGKPDLFVLLSVERYVDNALSLGIEKYLAQKIAALRLK